MISRSTIVAVAVVGLLVWPSPALADAVLVGSSPASNSTVGGTVSSVQLVFNEIVSDATIAIDAPGGPVVLDEVIDSGQVISASFPALTTEGRYIVRYAVMSADSDPVDGAFAFTYRVGAPEPLPVVAPALAEEGRDQFLVLAACAGLVLVSFVAGQAAMRTRRFRQLTSSKGVPSET